MRESSAAGQPFEIDMKRNGIIQQLTFFACLNLLGLKMTTKFLPLETIFLSALRLFWPPCWFSKSDANMVTLTLFCNFHKVVFPLLDRDKYCKV